MDEEISEDINKYDYRSNMGLCLEELNNKFICNNKVIPGEDLCKYHNDEQQTVDSEGYILDKKLYKKYMSDLLYYDNLYLLNIERKIKKDFKKNISYEYIIDIVNIEDKIIDIHKPNINVISFYGKVDYLDIKIEVFKFPIPDNKIYKHIYDKYIIYYKHVCNSDLTTKKVEPYKAYICYIQNSKQNFETISFIKLFNILNLVYNKKSIIKHIYEITYTQFDITNLIK